MQFEKRGIPAVVICTHVFEATAKFQAKALGLPDARIIVVPHPFSGIEASEAIKKAEAAFPALMAHLTGFSALSKSAAV